MTTLLAQFAQPFTFSWLQQVGVANGAVGRLLVACLLGGLIGIVVGLAASAVIGALAGWGFVFNPLTLVAATGFSLVVGVVFGVWPARQAAGLDPIVALRFE